MRVVTVASLVAGPVLRASRWVPFAVAAGVGFAIPAVPSVTSVLLGPDDLVGLLRVGAACVGVGIVFLFDDPAKPSTVAVPTPVGLLTTVRALLAWTAATLWWLATLGVTVAGAEDGVGAGLPRGDLTLEAATFAAVGSATALCLWRGSARGVISPTAAPAAVLLLVGALLLPERFALMAPVDGAAWAPAHDRWALVLTATAVVAVFATIRHPSRTTSNALRHASRRRRPASGAGDPARRPCRRTGP